MTTSLYDILTSPLFYVFILIWLIIDIAAEKRRQRLMEQMETLLHKPAIFDEDDDRKQTAPFYARNMLYKAATGVIRFLQEPLKGVIEWIRRGRDYLASNTRKPNKPLLFIGYTVSFVLLIIYFFLDIIAIVTALIAAGLVPTTFPEIFQRFQYVAIGGSLFGLLVGFYTLAQMTQKPSEFSDWDGVQGIWRGIARFLVFALIFFGVLAVVFLSFQLMVSLGFFPNESGTINGMVAFASTILTRINVALASILLMQDGFKGFILLGVVVLTAFWAFFIAVQYILRPLSVVLFFLIDVVYRLLLVALYLVWYIITTPIMLLVSLFGRFNAEDSAASLPASTQSTPTGKTSPLGQDQASSPPQLSDVAGTKKPGKIG